MGKRETRTIVVRKWATLTLLVLTSLGMAGLLYWLSGRAYATSSHATIDLVQRLLLRQGPPPSRQVLLASLMPVIANMLLFIPWGFLMFLALDTPRRPRLRTYVMTFLAGLLFAAAMELWQYSLPTRVTSWVDALSNALGALVGAIGGHLRKQVRVQFEY
jgi:VanZ family protein